jgi:starch phosphorylase
MELTYEKLEALALNLIWAWNRKADSLWEQLDPELWNFTHNPWVVLQTISREKMKKAIEDPQFCETVQRFEEMAKEMEQRPALYQKKHPDSPLSSIAYFSMEFMLSESLPIYSGGLGNVAGDQLKAASDLGLPVIAVGLLYQQGYFRQMIDKDGNQHDLYPYNSPGALPIRPLRKPDGEWIRIELILPGYSIWIRCWEAKVGRVKLYLLDSNDIANIPIYRGITSELYGGDIDLRFKQEIVLGIGGWRLLDQLGIQPDVCHLNEGHAALAVLERAKCYMKKTGISFWEALTATRPGNLFTTHTAVPAGFDRFPPQLIQQYLTFFANERLGISIDQLLALGRINPNDQSEPFNMAYLAIRGSGAVNGVSRLHGEVSRNIFSSAFPKWPVAEVPVGYVTNGVHTPSLRSKQSDVAWTEACGKDRWLGSIENLERDVRKISDEKLWEMRQGARQSMIEYFRPRIARTWAARGMSQEYVELAKRIFDPNVLTLGFARRFATYKRPNMLLHDSERLLRILTNPDHPVQLILAGKAHPADKPGQEMIHQWIQFIRRPEVRPHVIFLSDYDVLMSEKLVQGMDVWINTPRRPWEACGTSGMKVLVNGGLNVSELDGWWAEAYTPEVGWAIGDGKEHGDDPAWDAHEASQLYELLEQQIIPDFYKRNEKGISTTWVARIRESMARLTPQFSTTRSLTDYTENYYLPAAANYRKRIANNSDLAKEILKWQKALEQNWPSLRFGPLKLNSEGNQSHFEIEVYLHQLDPKAVTVELFASGTPPQRMAMNRKSSNGSSHIYELKATMDRSPSDFTPRVIPAFAEASVPLEAPYILWQK